MTINNRFDQEILDKIKEKNITPTPRWQFLFKDYVVWAFGILSLALGAVATSLVFFMLRRDNWEFYRRAGGEPLEFLLFAVPIFWLVCLGIFIGLVYYNIKHTKKGYRYSPVLILFLVVGLSIILGGALHGFGWGEAIDDLLGRKAPFYGQVMNPRLHFWDDAEKGRLAGMIIAETKAGEYTLVDPRRQEWSVLTGEAKIVPGAEIIIGQPARFLGQIMENHKFRAEEILPFGPGRGFMDRFRPDMNMMRPRGDGMPGKREAPLGCGFATTTAFDLLIKYPAVKAALEAGLLAQEDSIKEAVKNHPELLVDLQSFGVAPEVIGQIRGE